MESGYLPVTTAANDMDAIRASGLELTDNMEQILSGAVKTVRENELYTPTAFADGNAARKILEYSRPVPTGTRCWNASPQARARRQPRQSF